jgi:hypothetical protein
VNNLYVYVIGNQIVIFLLSFVTVNLSGADRVNMSHFDLLKVLGTGGKLN